MTFRRRATRVLLAILLLLPAAADARVARVEIDRRTVIAGGRAFGAHGAYERITGRIYFAFDPKNPQDRKIVDLALAPRNAKGEVEAWSEFVMLRPVDAAKGIGVALIDVVNRGGITTGVFHLGARNDFGPDSAAYYGDALLLRTGLTVVALGWQWDVAPGAPRLHFGAPPVRGANGKPVTGLVRADHTADAPARAFTLGHALGAGHIPYPVADTADAANVLTVRDGPTGKRTVVPRDRWRFAPDSAGGRLAEARDARWVIVSDGLEVGKIYELVYRATDPVVVGAGLAAVRDVASWLKHGSTELPRDSTHVAPWTRQVIAYGVSQTGRFLRHYVYQDFNTDEEGRQALDGIFAHTAGAGRGSFNHRFAQPSRDAQPYSTFFYPTDVFPFTSRVTTDPVTGATNGLLARATRGHLPRIFYVDGGYEYWGRGASLTHTTIPDPSLRSGQARDVGFFANERRYVIVGAQHSSPAAWPPRPETRIVSGDAIPSYRGSPLDQRLALRALLLDLVDWVRDDAIPPPSAYPTLDLKELVPPSKLAGPQLAGVPHPAAPTPVHRMSFGARWGAGLVDREPPVVGAAYPLLVPQEDSLGNEIGGIRMVELQAPLATYYPFQLREAPPRDRMVSFRGTFVPLAATEAERQARNDPRPSVEALWGTKERFLVRVDNAIRALVARRLMLQEDAVVARRRMEGVWEFVAGSAVKSER